MRARLVVGISAVLLASVVDGQAWFTTVNGVNARTTGFLSQDQYERVIVDAAGDVFGAGRLSTSSAPSTLDNRAVAMKHAGADGALLWQTLLGQPGGSTGSTSGIALDSAGDVLVAGGWSAGDFFLRFSVAKVAGISGAIAWERNILGTGLEHGRASDVAADADDDIVVVGTVDRDAAAFKLDGTSGATLWSRAIDGPAPNPEFDIFHRVALDAAGDVFVLSEFNNVVRQVRKLSGSTGADMWPAPLVAAAFDLAVDPAGDVVLFDLGTASMVVGKFSGTDGSVLWQETIPATSSFALAGAFDGDDPVVVGKLDDRFAVVKLDGATGGHLWTHMGPLDAEAMGVAVDGTGTIVAGGQLVDPVTSYDFYAVRLDAGTGAQLASYHLEGGHADVDVMNAFSMGPGGQVALAGSVDEGAGSFPQEFSDDMALLSFDDRLAGKSMVVLDQGSASRLLVRARDARLFASTPGGPQDPTLVGATLVLTNPSTLETATFPLPASRWSASAGIPKKQQYKYSDSTGSVGPCRTVTVKSGRVLKAKCLGSLGGFTLDEASQGSLNVRLRFGTTGAIYCLAFGGVTADAPGQFKAKSAPAPASCDYASPSGAFVD